MRHWFHYIAIAILTLVGPVEAVRTLTGPAVMACQCGCGAVSDADCMCPSNPMAQMPPMSPGSPGTSGSNCSTPSTPCSTRVSPTLASLNEKNQDEPDLDSERNSEPKPWPGDFIGRISVLSMEADATVLTDELQGTPRGRPIDALAKLAVFRI